MSSSDCLPDHPLGSDLVRRLKSALDTRDEETVRAVICTQVRHVDAVIELANDDWMKDPSAQLPPGALLGNQSPVLETIPITCACVAGEPFPERGGRTVEKANDSSRLCDSYIPTHTCAA